MFYIERMQSYFMGEADAASIIKSIESNAGISEEDQKQNKQHRDKSQKKLQRDSNKAKNH